MLDIHKKYLELIKNNFPKDSQEISDPNNWPKSWTEVEYKKYTRFLKFPLIVNKKVDFNIIDLLKKRSSDNLLTDQKITLEILSTILHFSFGKKVDSFKRFYPSAGGRYPLEAYLILKNKIESLEKGVYHYNILDNCLEFMWENDLQGNIFTPQENKNNSEIFVVITSVIQRAERKYGYNALKFSFIETGCAMQNLALLSTGFGVKNSLTNHNDILLEKLLDLDAENEFVTAQMCLDFIE